MAARIPMTKPAIPPADIPSLEVLDEDDTLDSEVVAATANLVDELAAVDETEPTKVSGVDVTAVDVTTSKAEVVVNEA